MAAADGHEVVFEVDEEEERKIFLYFLLHTMHIMFLKWKYCSIFTLYFV